MHNEEGEDNGIPFINYYFVSAEPFFMVELEDRFIDTGSDLKWRCEADGLPGPDYFWLKDGKQITSDDAKRITVRIDCS